MSDKLVNIRNIIDGAVQLLDPKSPVKKIFEGALGLLEDELQVSRGPRNTPPSVATVPPTQPSQPAQTPDLPYPYVEHRDAWNTMMEELTGHPPPFDHPGDSKHNMKLVRLLRHQEKWSLSTLAHVSGRSTAGVYKAKPLTTTLPVTCVSVPDPKEIAEKLGQNLGINTNTKALRAAAAAQGKSLLDFISPTQGKISMATKLSILRYLNL